MTCEALPAPWLRAIVDHIQDAIVLLDGSGAIVFESPSAREILGMAPDALQRAFGLGRIHPEEREVVVQAFERTASAPGATARATYRFERADGGWRHLEAVAKNLLHDADLGGVLITFRDVTDRAQALEAAERAGRARDEFLSRMSHELRTPLHAILGWAQLLEARDDPQTREAVEQISGAGNHLLKLVEETLDLAAIREGQVKLDLRPVDVHALALQAMEMIRPLASQREVALRISSTITPGLIVVADAGRLCQVLINLLSNAVKYNRYGGEVMVGWTIDSRDHSMARIWVRDTGPGIAEDRLINIFQRFERLGMDAAGIEGVGLGLAICRRLVELMRGAIGVENRHEGGAEFWIRMPRPRRPRRRHHRPHDLAGVR